MTVIVERHTDARRINEILNDESVRPWVADLAEGTLDISAAVANRANVLLMGEHGGCMFFRLMPGIYEVHTQVLAHGRGRWTRAMTQACTEWMFVRTDAVEIMTRIPVTHRAAAAAAVGAHMAFDFRRPAECRFRGQVVDVDIYSLPLLRWVQCAGGLVERGRWFHGRLHDEAERLGITEPPHPDDEDHNRVVGAAASMAFGNQPAKAVALYNRWALASRHAAIQLVSDRFPAAIKCDIGIVEFGSGDISVRA